MKKRKFIRLNCDMYEDTKFKIIDTMDNRDTINYIWTRLLTLGGKVSNSFGELFVSKNMPYTIELLALEFNRSVEAVENAIGVFIDLNMMDKNEEGVFRICNFAKHQGIKIADEEKLDNKNDDTAIKTLDLKELRTKKRELESIKEKDSQDCVSQNKESKKQKAMQDIKTAEHQEKQVTRFENSNTKVKEINLVLNNDYDSNNNIKETNEIPKDIRMELDQGIKEACTDKVLKKQPKRKKRKEKVEEIAEIDEEDVYEEFSGIDLDIKDLGRVVKTFNFG